VKTEDEPGARTTGYCKRAKSERDFDYGEGKEGHGNKEEEERGRRTNPKWDENISERNGRAGMPAFYLHTRVPGAS